jgi:hypothetical protein
MGSVSHISDIERAAALTAAICFARDVVRDEAYYLKPASRLGSLSEFEWEKLAEAIISGWIIERSKQLTGERFGHEHAFLAMGQDPEPAGLGHCAVTLPALGQFVEDRGLTDKPIGDWSKMDVLLFVWNAADMVLRATEMRDERPSQLPAKSVLMAG